IRLSARAAVGRTAHGSLAGFLAVRRLARVADAATPIRILVAACVVAALSVTAATQVNTWTDDTARLRTGAPLQVSLADTDAVGALTLTRRLDPDGRWLMAAVLFPGEGSVVARRAFLDTSRYDRVVGDFLSGTAAAGVTSRIDDLASGDSSVATAGRLHATVHGVSARRSGQMRPVVRVTYRAGSTEHTTRLRLGIEPTGAASSASAPVTGCAAGCVVTGITLSRSPGDTTLPWVLTGLRLGDVDVLAQGWKPEFEPRNFRGTLLPGGPVVSDEGLLAVATRRPLTAVPAGATATLPILATATATWDGSPLVDSTGGEELAADVLDRLPALPLVEADGLLADLATAAAGAPPTVPAAEVMILARSDTPADVRSAVAAAGGSPPRTLGSVERTTAAETGAAQARVYALMAVFCLLAALLVLLAAVARQRSAWLREVAALRVVGVSTAQLRRSARVEIGWLAAAAALATVAGAVAAIRLLLAHLALVTVPVHAVPLRTGVTVGPVVLAAVLVALVVLVVSGRGRAIQPELSRPAILREEGSA
ncbi:MAG: FtsX-like permease family protein, partial [Nocardioides sp.]|nr:FtsX-like permease family protein [Nocardioides sp.]